MDEDTQSSALASEPAHQCTQVHAPHGYTETKRDTSEVSWGSGHFLSSCKTVGNANKQDPSRTTPSRNVHPRTAIEPNSRGLTGSCHWNGLWDETDVRADLRLELCFAMGESNFSDLG